MVRYAFRKGTEKNRLLAAGRRVCEATKNLAVFGRAAHFLDSRQTAQLRRGADYNEFQTVLDGLAALADGGGWRPIAPPASPLRQDAGRGAARILSLTVIGKKSYI